MAVTGFGIGRFRGEAVMQAPILVSPNSRGIRSNPEDFRVHGVHLDRAYSRSLRILQLPHPGAKELVLSALSLPSN